MNLLLLVLLMPVLYKERFGWCFVLLVVGDPPSTESFYKISVPVKLVDFTSFSDVVGQYVAHCIFSHWCVVFASISTM